MTPSKQQQAILSFVKDNPDRDLGIVARAGCGKTTTLVSVANTTQGSTFIGAFNKSIAEELATRPLRPGIKTGTLHSEGFRAWRRTAPKVKVDERKVAKIIDELFPDSIKESAEGQIGKLVSLAKQNLVNPNHPPTASQKLLDIIDHHDITSELSDNDLADCALQALLASTHKDSSVIDFDDMIYSPLIHSSIKSAYDWVMIDEAQDTNPARRALSLELGRSIVYVGDDKQAIYGFTGASADAMALLREVTEAQEFPLTLTYRCASAIVSEAQRYVPDIEAAPSNSKGMVERITANPGENFAFKPDDAILCRNTRPLVSVAYRLMQQSIPCYIEGRDIGAGLKRLAQRFRVKNLSNLLDHLEQYEETEYAKNADKPWKIAALADKIEALKVLIGIASQNTQNDITFLLTLIDHLFGDKTQGARVTLSTIHRAKGREWDRVFLLNQDTLIPSRYAQKGWMIEQENNLAYVAITRAKNHLVYLTVPNV